MKLKAVCAVCEHDVFQKVDNKHFECSECFTLYNAVIDTLKYIPVDKG